MPLLPPVMTATFPSSFFDMGLLLCPWHSPAIIFLH
jgi:hypothetical protein